MFSQAPVISTKPRARLASGSGSKCTKASAERSFSYIGAGGTRISRVELILTGVDTRSPATAIGISGGRIAALGDERDAREWRTGTSELVDLGGASVWPGLTDAHFHPVMGLNAAVGADLNGAHSLAEIQERLRKADGSGEHGDWVLGWGLTPDAFEGLPLSGSPLDEWFPGRPALVYLFDGHAAVASRAALNRAGVTGVRDLGTTASIAVDPAGRPTGLLQEAEAIDLVRRLLPVESLDQRADRLAGILGAMAATGLTGGHVMDCQGDSLALLAALEFSGRLPLRLRLHPVCGPFDDPEEIVAQQRLSGSRWRVAGVKFYLDGTIDGGTAWLSAPDCSGASISPYWPSAQSYSDAVRYFDAAGIGTATHAIGDAAVAHVLDTIDALPVGSPARHRIEHLEYVRDDQLARLGGTRAIVSMQPTHLTDYVSPDGEDNWSMRLGRPRAEHGWRFGEILAAGATLALGSDWPVAHYDPRRIVAAAQLRRPAGRRQQAPLGFGAGLTAAQAMAGYTSGPAYAAGLESVAGRIAPGHLADLTVFAADPMRVDPDDLPELPVTATVVDGQLYRTD